MQKTTVYLPDALKRRLAQAAHRRGQPEAALIRAAIERLLDGGGPAPADAAAVPERRPDPAERVDEALAGFGE